MIINLFGPPGSGKTTLASLLCVETPGLSHLSIDSYRKDGHRDSSAWYELVRNLLIITGDVIIESSGLSRNLKQYVLDRYECRKRNIVNVYISCSEEECLRRVKLRHKPQVPFQYKGLTLENVIKHVISGVPDAYNDLGYYDISTEHGNVEKSLEDFRRIYLMGKAAEIKK